MGKAGCRVCRVRSGSKGFSGICWMEAVHLAGIPCWGPAFCCQVQPKRA